ncbi:firmicute transcriptional repressor of class III stress genes [Clostridium aceticum]|uniref:Transcriptional regulator CtsR n=1 Tax=Clostridium aceticum TaxID=84022 RepID=A0A0D8I7Q0_9CLOT|nr:CtsR family transcriptional regulator [Clostridium aceticum]AKL97091.1 firmicute transcriptional repressor of class III stress genes [Clostridium aceticum]KJF26047.1 CtsR family transcriptional regulator [Clostridium aceticum]
MARISDAIEAFLKELIKESKNQTVEIQRNELAKYFECAPSQINYVLMTRFDYSRGYYIESQRGGGGYIKIRQLIFSENENLYYFLIKEIGNSITKSDANRRIESLRERGIISLRESKLMRAAVDDAAIISPLNIKDEIRANILKNMVATLLG